MLFMPTYVDLAFLAAVLAILVTPGVLEYNTIDLLIPAVIVFQATRVGRLAGQSGVRRALAPLLILEVDLPQYLVIHYIRSRAGCDFFNIRQWVRGCQSGCSSDE